MAMTEVSPVTEAEVTTFAQRIVTTIVSVSQQAREIEVLSNRLNSLATEISGYMDETRRLKAEVAEGWEFVKTVEDERDKAKRATQEAEGRVQEAQADAARAWDGLNQYKANSNASFERVVDENRTCAARIAELEQALASAQQLHSNEVTRNTNLNNDLRNTQSTVEFQGRIIRETREEKDRFVIELRDCHSALDLSNTKLTTVQAKLNDLRSLFDAPKTEEVAQGNVLSAINF